MLDGAGAAASGDARWNGKGRHIIYAAEHYATAFLEKAAQLNAVVIPRSLVYIEIEIPDEAGIEELRGDDLPGWADEDKRASRAFGDRWYDARRSVVLLVPSLAAPGIERNVLINQRHPEFARIAASASEPVRGHPRLLV